MPDSEYPIARQDWVDEPLSGTVRLCLSRPIAWLIIVLPSLILGVIHYRIAPGIDGGTPVMGVWGPQSFLGALPQDLSGGAVAAVVVGLGLWLVNLTTGLVLLIGFQRELEAQLPDISSSVRLGLRRLPPAILVSLVALIPWLPFSMMGVLADEIDPYLDGLIGCLSWPLIVLWSYIMLRLMFAEPAVAVAGRSALGGLRHSWDLSRGNVLALIGYWIALSVVGALLTWPLILATSVLPITSTGAAESWLGASLSVVGVLYMVVSSALVILLWHKFRQPEKPVKDAQPPAPKRPRRHREGWWKTRDPARRRPVQPRDR